MITRAVAGPTSSETTTAGPRRHGRRPVAVALMASLVTGLLAWGLATFAVGSPPRLVIHDHSTGAQAYVRTVEVGETFELIHTHSVTGRAVVETFSVLDPRTVAIEELWFDQHGANLPTGPERIGDTVTTYIEEEDGYRVRHHGHAIGTLPLMVGGPDVDHVLRFADGDEVRLLDVARAGARVEVVLGSPG